MGVVRGVATLHDHMMYMVILVMYDHFHGIKSLFCPMEHKFPAVNKKYPQNLLSKPVPLYGAMQEDQAKRAGTEVACSSEHGCGKVAT